MVVHAESTRMALLRRRAAAGPNAASTSPAGRGAKSVLLALAWFIAFAGWACAVAGLFALGSSCHNANVQAANLQKADPASNAVALNRAEQ